jgi:hypothetical protein
MFVYITGILIGIAIRSGSPLSINLAEPLWKQCAGMPLTIGDLTEVDKDFVPGNISLVYYVTEYNVRNILVYCNTFNSLYSSEVKKNGFKSVRENGRKFILNA